MSNAVGSFARMIRLSFRLLAVVVVNIATATSPTSLPAQNVRTLLLDRQDGLEAGGALPVDRGIVALRQRLRSLRTTGSVLQTTAHPDDEQSGLLTYLARGTGVRTALLTLNRGEAGANALGSELFDALGMLRTEELLLADRYYGLDDQYFTSAADYGYSKTVREAARSWDTTAVLRDMVRVIRANQPLLVISRWYGGARDGHGQHSMAGVLTPLAVAAAADSTRFPEQFREEGVRPWRVLRLFRANLPASDRADVVIDPARFDPWLGVTYQSLGAEGLSRQRSQNSGQRSFALVRSPQRLQLVRGTPGATRDDLFAGLDTSLPGVFSLLGERAPAGALAALRRADALFMRAIGSELPNDSTSLGPTLAQALHELRIAATAARPAAPHSADVIDIKIRQCERTLADALGLTLSATTTAGNTDGHPVVPGEQVQLQLAAVQHVASDVALDSVTFDFPASWSVEAPRIPSAPLKRDEAWSATTTFTVPRDAEPARAAFYRGGIAENLYRSRAASPTLDPRGASALGTRFHLTYRGVRFAVNRAIRYRQSHEPDGVVFPRLVVVPPVSLQIAPAVGVVTDTGEVSAEVTVEVTGNALSPVEGDVTLHSGVSTTPLGSQHVRLTMGERRSISFTVTLPRGRDVLSLSATARIDGRDWGEQGTRIDHRELEPAYLYSPATSQLRRIDVAVVRGLKVGYIMGVGDVVPAGIAQLGAEVTLLDAAAVSAGNFGQFDAIVVGTRAYAVRPELPAATNALMDFAKRGGQVVVLYQTQEFKPERYAPYPALLPDDAAETSEEDAAVQILAPQHPLLNLPNHISQTDFTGWIEQRGSKFLTKLAPQYTALLETHDEGEGAQDGVYVTAPVGAGRWSYVALALHRQLPYAVPGAYRILANLIAAGARK